MLVRITWNGTFRKVDAVPEMAPLSIAFILFANIFYYEDICRFVRFINYIYWIGFSKWRLRSSIKLWKDN